MLHRIVDHAPISTPRSEALARIVSRVDELSEGAFDDNGKQAISHFGQVACIKELRLQLVPFFEPCVIFVLSGTKHLGEEVVGEGGALAVPAPASFHMGNVPHPDTGQYQALVFPFTSEDAAHVRSVLASEDDLPLALNKSTDIVTYDFDGDALQALDHYLKSGNTDSPARIQHRKREVLLILAERDPRILSLADGVKGWGERLRELFAEDPAHAWTMEDVCQRLAVTESTLRRALRREDTSFRDTLSEFRLANALMSVLMSSAPIYLIAHDNGFQSVSRFSENFRKRFGATPTDVRNSLPENG